MLGQVLAEAAGAVIHHGRDLGQVGATAKVGQLGHAVDPGALRLR